MAATGVRKKKPSKRVAPDPVPTTRQLGRKRTGPTASGRLSDRCDLRPSAEARKCKTGRTDGHYGDGEVWGFVFIAGPTGSGKSREADRLVERANRCVKFVPPNVVIDPNGWPVFQQPKELIEFIAAHRKGSFRCIYQPAPLGDVEEHFEYVCRIIRRAEDVIFYIDEVDQMCSPNGMMAQRSPYWNLPDNKYRRPAFADLIDSGRHAGIALVMISRVPAQVNRKVTANCQEMRIFRQSEPNVLKYFSDKAGSEMAEMLPLLGDYEYVLWQDGKRPIIAGGSTK